MSSTWQRMFGRKLASNSPARRPAAKRPLVRLEATQLEARDVPALFTVTSTADTATAGTLRQAILDANAAPGADTIQFDTSAAPFNADATIALTSILPTITGSVSIENPGANVVAISGNLATAIASIDNGAVSQIDVSFSKVNLINARSATSGAAIRLTGNENLTFSSVTLDNNKTTTNSTASGGAIFISSASTTFTANSSTISNNGSTLAGNASTQSFSGGAIYLSVNSPYTTITLNNSLITSNSAITNGGFFYSDTTGYGTVINVGNSTFTANKALNSYASTVTQNTQTGSGGVFNFSANTTINVASSTFSSNTASNSGVISLGAFCSVTLTSSTVTNNVAVAFNTVSGFSGSGGFLSGGGTLSFSNSLFSGNAAGTAGWGGVLSLSTAVTSFSNCTVSNNSAGLGGVYSKPNSLTGGTVTLTNSIFSGNSATFGGGVIEDSAPDVASASARTTIDSCSFTNNFVGGSTASTNAVGGALSFTAATGNSSFGKLSISNSYFGGNSVSASGTNTEAGNGGAIAVDAIGTTIRNTTFTGNSARNGGAIAILNSSGLSDVQLLNSTVADNTATQTGTSTATLLGGGGIFVRYSSGIDTSASPKTNFASSIIAHNTAYGNATQAFAYNQDIQFGGLGATLNATYSLIGNAENGNFGFSSTSGNNVTGTFATPVDPLLNAAANNGGATLTRSLQVGSPAINAGSNAFGYAYDQRGAGFDRVQSYISDIGAFESSDALPYAVSTTYTSIPAATVSNYTFTVTYKDAQGIGFASLSGANADSIVLVTGPGGYSQFAKYLSASPGSDSTSIVVSYSVPANTAGIAGWDSGDNGTYTVSVTGGLVADIDTTPNSIPTTTVGTFAVAVPNVFVVNTTSDDTASPAAGSLRWAIQQANGFASQLDSITFDTALAGQTITLAGSLTTITDSVTINGSGAAGLTISGNGAYQIFGTSSNSATLNISNLTLTKAAGGVLNPGPAVSSTSGGAVTLSNLVISDSTSSAQAGIVQIFGAVGSSITNTVFTRNYNNTTGTQAGGALYISGGTTSIDTTSFLYNNSGAQGGLFTTGNATVSVDNSTFYGNVSSRDGAALVAYLGAVLNIKNTTFTANSTTSETATTTGGAIFIGSTGTVTISISNSIIAGNTAPGAGKDIGSGTATATLNMDLQNNFIGVNSGYAFVSGANNIFGITNPQLSTPANYGGSTVPVSYPLFGSPVINAGITLSPTDQIGTARPQGAAADIGAVEYVSAQPSATGSASSIGVSGGTANTITVTYVASSDTASFETINFSKLDNSDISVRTPSGSLLGTTFLGATPSTDAKTIVATYSVTAPGGTWTFDDSGSYAILLNASQVTNNSAVAVPASTLGTFNVAIGTTFVVTDTSDNTITPTVGSLRWAVQQSNALVFTPDTITFNLGGASTIFLNALLPTITDSVTFQGQGSSSTAISGNGAYRVLTINGSGAYGPNGAGKLDVKVNNLTITQGLGNPGGGISVGAQSLTLNDVRFVGNRATGSGGAIGTTAAGSVITIINSTFDSNSTTNNFNPGGAIAISNASTVSITGSTFSNNVGGAGAAINFSSSGSLSIDNSTFSGNIAGFYSGSSLGGNSANNGGAINLSNTSTTTITTVNIRSSTFANNSANYAGTSGTVTSNGGAIFTAAGTSLTITSSILAGNLAGTVSVGAGPDIKSTGTVTINGSVIGVGSGTSPGFTLASGTGNLTGSVTAPLAAGLDTLAFNGGLTQTRALLPGSPALDLGAATSALTNDQRGAPWARVYNGKLDAGAYEFQPLPNDLISPVASGYSAATVTTRNGTSYTFTVTYTDNDKVKVSTIGTGDITVTGPGGYLQVATFVSKSSNIDAASVTATYSITPPGGKWDASDNGAYTITLNAGQITDITTNPNVLTEVGTFAVQAPVAVSSVQFTNDSTTFSGNNVVQRSGVKYAKVVYDSIITYSGSDTAAYTVLAKTGNVPVTFTVNTTTVGNHSEAILTFTSSLTPGSASLTDGRYVLTVLGTQVQTVDLPTVFLDGDNNGTPGGNYINNFFRFYGDANGDENVDLTDIDIFSAAFGSTQGDSNYLAYMNDDSSIGDVDIDLGDIDSFSNSFALSVLP